MKQLILSICLSEKYDWWRWVTRSSARANPPPLFGNERLGWTRCDFREVLHYSSSFFFLLSVLLKVLANGPYNNNLAEWTGPLCRFDTLRSDSCGNTPEAPGGTSAKGCRQGYFYWTLSSEGVKESGTGGRLFGLKSKIMSVLSSGGVSEKPMRKLVQCEYCYCFCGFSVHFVRCDVQASSLTVNENGWADLQDKERKRESKIN